MQKSDRNLDFVFDKMIRLIEGGWQQHIMAKDSKGEPCYIEDADARSFDLWGAFNRVFLVHPNMGRFKDLVINGIIAALRESGDEKAGPLALQFHLNVFNDAIGRTKLDVVRLLKQAKEKVNG